MTSENQEIRLEHRLAKWLSVTKKKKIIYGNMADADGEKGHRGRKEKFSGDQRILHFFFFVCLEWEIRNPEIRKMFYHIKVLK